MKNYPEYVKCVKIGTDIKTTETWCGTKVIGFTFQDAAHASVNALQSGRLLICPECSKKIQETITSGTWSDGSANKIE